MFCFNFYKEPKKDVLQEKHRKLVEEAYKMSSTNRTKSDELVAKATEIEMKLRNRLIILQ